MNKAADKSYADRVKEDVTVLRQLHEYGISSETSGYSELKHRMDTYIKTGDPWMGKVPMPDIKKTAHLLLPRRARDAIQLSLKHM